MRRRRRRTPAEGEARTPRGAPAGAEVEPARPGVAPGEPSSEEPVRVIDPTHVLLSRVKAQSRIPWGVIGAAVAVALWIPVFANLGVRPVQKAEAQWITDALAPAGQHSAGSAFALALTRAAWKLQGADVHDAKLDEPGARAAIRLPFAVAGLGATLLFFGLSRIMIGSPAAVLAVALLAATEPWTHGGASALPLVVGEMMVLLGVVWAMTLQARHREVGVAGITAGRVGIAGIFLGLGILLTPAAFATFLATLLIWLLVGIRRSRADATTLQAKSPARTVVFTVFGSVLLLAASLAAVYAAERIAGGSGFPSLVPNRGALLRGVKLWSELYDTLLSPGRSTDALLLASLVGIVVLRAVEWRGGRPWHTAGLAPWVFLGLWVLAAQRDGRTAELAGQAAQLKVPVILPPLFIVGLGWLVLRGLHIGTFRRQEYTFLLVWLGVSLLMVPLVPGSHPYAPQLAAAVTLLPPMLLLVGRAGRVLWESKTNVVARAAILAFLFLPVAWSVAEAAGGKVSAALPARLLPALLVGAAALGALAEIVTVRPDPVPSPHRPHGRSGGGPRRGGRRRGGGGRGAGRGGGRGTRGDRGRRQAA